MIEPSFSSQIIKLVCTSPFHNYWAAKTQSQQNTKQLSWNGLCIILHHLQSSNEIISLSQIAQTKSSDLKSSTRWQTSSKHLEA